MKKGPSAPQLTEHLSDREITRRVLHRIIHAADAHQAAQVANADAISQVYQPVLGKEDFTGREVFLARRDFPKSGLVRPEAEHSYSKIFSDLPREEQCQWWALQGFLEHDIRHIGETEIGGYTQQLAFWSKREGDRLRDYAQRPLRPEFRDIVRAAMLRTPQILRQAQYPHQFTKALAQMKLGRPPSDLEEVDTDIMLDTILTSLQLRFGLDDYLITTPGERRPDRNELIMDLTPSRIETNPGMLWSVLYNLLKNATKEVSTQKKVVDPTGKMRGYLNARHDLANRLVRDELPESPIKIHVKVEDLGECDATIIHIMDSGEGLKVDEIMASLKKIVTRELLAESDLKISVKRVLAQWEDNPFAVRALRMGDVYDLAGLARVSGFATQARINSHSSGLGLWGATYLSKRMGGEILYTNTATGGALFTVIIPNHYFTNADQSKRTIRSGVRDIRRQLEKGSGFQHTFPKAA